MVGNTPLKLTEEPAVLVPFQGERSAVGPLTLGQLNILEWVTGPIEPLDALVFGSLDIPAGTPVEQVATALAGVVSRHEGLRTTFTGGADPTQRITDAGILTIRVFEMAEDADASAVRSAAPGVPPALDLRKALETELKERLRAPDPGPLTQLPTQVAVATRDGVALAAVFAGSHLVLDALAAAVVRREFAEILADPVAGRPPATRHQPLDQAAAERAPAGRRRAEAALRYWRDQLGWLPQCLYAAPLAEGCRGSGDSVAGELTSPGAGIALRHIAARTGASRPTIVLAAVSAVLAQRTGYQRLGVPTLSGNRFERRLFDYVGTLVQAGLTVVEVGQRSFDELIRRTWTSVVRASKYGAYDVVRQVALRERSEHLRGLNFVFEPLFNNIVIDAPAAQPGAAPAVPPIALIKRLAGYTSVTWRKLPPTRAIARFDLFHLERALVLQLWSGDTARLPEGEVESLLRAVERLLVAAASDDLDHAGWVAAIGLEPIRRGEGWLFVDSCWVELAEVQRLLDTAFGPASSQVFAAVDGEPLVAYVAASERVPDPERAHQLCLAALPGRSTAMTPRRYVLFESAPADLTDQAAWQGMVTEGTGRSPNHSTTVLGCIERG